MPLQYELPKSYRRIFIDPIVPSVTVGAVTGASGLLAGGFAGILISKHPALFSIAAGFQCFSLGSSFWYFRNAFIEASTRGEPTSSQKLTYSALAGSLAGALNGAFRSRANVLPGAIMIGLMGAAGQVGYNTFSATRQSESSPHRSVLQQLTESPWVPVKALSDEQYEEMLQQKLLKLDAKISIIDEKIAHLKAVKEGLPYVDSGGEISAA